LVADRIEREILIDAPIDVVWAVVTKPEHIQGWFSDAVELDLRPGGKLVLHWEGHGRVDGWVERVEPPQFFSFRWVLSGDSSTLVEFSLAAEGERTRLTVVESGFRELPGPEEARREHFDGHTRGWELELGHLQEYAERL
jgi:uncharacterized protein YndB with AHSA1/START domain